MLNGSFVLNRHLTGFAKDLRSDGAFTLVPEKGLIWRVTAPFSSTTAITPNGILQIAGGEEAMRLPASSQPGLGHLYVVLSAAVSGDITPLEKLFVVHQSGTAAHWQIVLTPLHSGGQNRARLQSLTLAGGQYVESVDIDKGGGDVDRISLFNQKVAPATLSAGDVALLEILRK